MSETRRRRPLVLALDCGTTGNRAIVFDRGQKVLASSYREFTQHYPRPGWVEHDAEEIWTSVRGVLGDVLRKVPARLVGAIGVTNQRETLVVWERATGRPIHRAIVWQCRRSAAICAELKKRGLEARIHRRTGLFLDPYFSGTKVLWLVRRHPALARGLARGELVLGTIDAWIVWKLTDGASFSTDPTNASRTLLFDIRRGRWDPDLCRLFGAPPKALPEVLPSAGPRGTAARRYAGAEIPIAGVAGDQQAAAFAQGCFRPGVVKNTYGTGLFVVAETGPRPRFSKRLVTTVAASAGPRLQYALEGSIFIGGAAVQWLRDGLKIIRDAAETERLARGLASNDGVYFVPALVGLGSPHWDPHARGLIIGITRQTGAAHFARAALEAMAYQTRDVLDCMHREGGLRVRRLGVDGGAAKNDLLMQFQADIAGCEVERPTVTETTALGAAGLAGIDAGLWRSKEDFLKSRKVDRIFRPKMDRPSREKLCAGWRKAVERSKGWAETGES
jgi:glycerol kinase